MSEIGVFLTVDSKAVYYWADRGLMLYIQSQDMPDTKPSGGMIELSRIYVASVSGVKEVVEKVVSIYNDDEHGIPRVGSIYRELETYNDDEIEDHLITEPNTTEVESTNLIDFLDLINMEGLGTIGSNEYYTEFQKIDTVDNSAE